MKKIFAICVLYGFLVEAKAQSILVQQHDSVFEKKLLFTGVPEKLTSIQLQELKTKGVLTIVRTGKLIPAFPKGVLFTQSYTATWHYEQSDHATLKAISDPALSQYRINYFIVLPLLGSILLGLVIVGRIHAKEKRQNVLYTMKRDVLFSYLVILSISIVGIRGPIEDTNLPKDLNHVAENLVPLMLVCIGIFHITMLLSKIVKKPKQYTQSISVGPGGVIQTL